MLSRRTAGVKMRPAIPTSGKSPINKGTGLLRGERANLSRWEMKESKVVTTESGLKYEDLKEGTGAEATAGNMVEVHYTGWLKDGKKFDSSVDRKKPFGFKLGAGQVIKGWDEGVAGMKVGGKRKLTIPPDAELTFEVELLKIK